jgi:hypothetical protein
VIAHATVPMRQCRQGREHHQRWKEQPDRLRQGTPVEVAMGQPEVGRQGESDELLTGCRHEDQQGGDQPCASNWTDPEGSSLLTLPASSVQTDPDGSRRIQTDRLDDHWDDQGSFDRKSDGKTSYPDSGYGSRAKRGLMVAAGWRRKPGELPAVALRCPVASGPSRPRHIDLGGEHPTGARRHHLGHAPPFGCHHEQCRPVGAAERAGEAAAV